MVDFDKEFSFLKEKHGNETWVTIYKKDVFTPSEKRVGYYCSLVSKEFFERTAIKQTAWDLSIGTKYEKSRSYYQEGGWITEYIGYDNEHIEGLVHIRDFHGIESKYIEISEEFRFFHNLYHDRENNKFIDLEEGLDIIQMSEHEVKVRRTYLNQYMFAKNKHLLLYWDYMIWTSQEVHVTFQHEVEEQNFLCHFSCLQSEPDMRYCSRLLGKKLIQHEQPIEKAKEFEEFIIGGDDEKPQTCSCNPDNLANYFGANPRAPHFLTPVFFKKAVLDKYYQSDKYHVEDGYLQYAAYWGIQIDNGNPEHISVFLGDLGSLPHVEQMHWKAHNILPDGRELSEMCFRRSMLAEFAENDNPEFVFKSLFQQLNNTWNEKFGWKLFLDLTEKDEHYLKNITIPSSNDQKTFDEIILSLTKSTVDSLNVKDMRTYLELEEDNAKSIALFQSTLEKIKFSDANSLISFVRSLQELRSNSSAHRKGKNFEKLINKNEYLKNKQYQIYIKETLEELSSHLSNLLDFIKNKHKE